MDDELKATSGLFYKKDVADFKDIESFIHAYPKGTILIPLTPDPDAFLNPDKSYSDKNNIGLEMQKDWEYYNEELTLRGKKNEDLERLNLYKDLYDSRLVRPYMVCKDNSIQKMNVKMMGSKDPNKKGLLGTVVDAMEYDEKKIKTFNFISIKAIGKVTHDLSKLYDKHVGKRKLVFWIPLWQVSNCYAIVLHILNRIDVILT